MIAQRYELRAMLGSGSMGTVWSAYDTFLQRLVAVKEVRLPEGFDETRSAELRERTLREARAIAVLAHPNVIVLHDVAREDGEPFVVMELLSGRSLADLVHSRGPLSTSQAAAVADAVAAALEAAHDAGITHRDVKPGNVLVGAGGQIKLTDFGIARNVSEDTMTSTGVLLGSPAYIAPEVAAGSPATPAADLWGLGATLFTALEGRPPYDVDGDPLETVGEVVHGDVPRPSAGPLAEAVTGLMAKEPAARIGLSEVRQRLFPLLDAPVHTLFDAEVRGDPSTGGPSSAPAGDEPPADGSPPPPDADAERELADDPGPLPFAPAHSAPAGRRGPARTAVLAVVSAVLFLAAAVGGFAAARYVGGRPLLPHQEEAGTPFRSPDPGLELVRREGDATNLRGVTGGEFSISVPTEWARFVTRSPGNRLPRSTLVQFVSPDGARAVSVQRFAGYFPAHSVAGYPTMLRERWGDADFVLADQSGRSDSPGERTITYRTVQRPVPGDADSGRSVNRTTIARLIRRDSNLWVLGVTVPTAQEATARTRLFDRSIPTFRITG